VPAFGDSFSALLSDPGVEAVYIASPHHLHFPMLMECIRQGKPALCEKPLALSIDEGLALATACRQAKVKVGVNHQFRYDRGCYTLAAACREGELGEVGFASCRTDFFRGPEYFVQGPWRGTFAQSGGGALFTHGTHALDIALWALDSPPRRAWGRIAKIRNRNIEVEDWGLAVFELESGASIELRSTLLEKTLDPVKVDLFGSLGQGHYRGFLRSRLRFDGVTVKPRLAPAKGFHAFLRSLEGFRRWIQEDIPYLTPLPESLPVLFALRAAYASAQSGNAENVDMRFREFIEK
jgi:predicted dehydrogenase